MAISTILAAVASPWTSNSKSTASDQHRPLLHLEVPSSGPSYHNTTASNRSYGATNPSGLSSKTSLDRQRRDSLLNQVLEEEDPADDGDNSNENDVDEDDDWELEELGLYRGSYKRLITLYTIVPLSCLLVFTALALLLNIYPSHSHDTYPHPTYLPFPLPELLASTALWSLSHLLRSPLFTLSTLLTPSSNENTLIALSTLLHVLTHNLLRLSSLPLLLIRHQMNYPHPTWRDPAFRRVWWLALGWGVAEVVVGVAQGFEQIGMYRDVLVGEGKDEEFLRGRGGEGDVRVSQVGKSVAGGAGSVVEGLFAFPGGPPSPINERQRRDLSPNPNDPSALHDNDNNQQRQEFTVDSAVKLQVDRDLDQLIALKGREEIEEVYGIPVIKIPVFVSCLQRINAIILSMGLTLLLSASYLSSPLSQTHTHPRPPIDFRSTHTHILAHKKSSNTSFYITLPVVIILHWFLSLLHTSLFLPRMGVHTAAYIGLLVGLGTFFAGLGMWEALS